MTIDKIVEAIEDAERGPTPEDLDRAPVLTDWVLVLDGVILRAEGDIAGHPTIDGPWIRTSPVLAFDVGAGWMRTRSCWYRLGARTDIENLALIEATAQRLLAALRRRYKERASTEKVLEPDA